MRMNSAAIYERACKVIPGGVNSPVRSFRHLSMLPMIVESGKGSKIKDADGKEYIDFCGSWGALILGHAHPQVVEAVRDQAGKGFSFGIATELEERLASLVVDLIPSIEKIRFVSSGTEATMTALRLARGYTGKTKILKFTGHYHGHSDSLLVQAGSGVAKLNSSATSKGVNAHVAADTICIPFNDFEALKEAFAKEKDIAALILEPVTGNMGVVLPKPGFLELIREETKKAGALLVFDEVITGFRLGLQGAQGTYGIDPDLTCFGKIVGGGFPVAAVGGKAAILDELAPLGQVYQAGTLSGNPVAVRAGLETLQIIKQEGFYPQIFAKVNRMTTPLKEALKNKNACLQEAGGMFNLFFGVKEVHSKEDLSKLDNALFIEFFKYLFERGVYISPHSNEAWFMSIAHSDAEIDEATSHMLSFLKERL